MSRNSPVSPAPQALLQSHLSQVIEQKDRRFSAATKTHNGYAEIAAYSSVGIGDGASRLQGFGISTGTARTWPPEAP